MILRLRGFRCHQDKTYDLGAEGLVLLEGDSGAGKSTVFEALAWCLYG